MLAPPPRGLAPLRKILDPPLETINFVISFSLCNGGERSDDRKPQKHYKILQDLGLYNTCITARGILSEIIAT